jgi:UDP:flavonoid glycosyltransferase YjiC (YdhE family)
MNFPTPALLPPPGSTVLVAALNWGLGHATRSTAIIRALLARGCKVHLASDGAALAFWRKEFPDLVHHELPAWSIRYAPGLFLIPSLLAQLPRIAWAIAKEHRQVQELVRDHGITWILSDNRYGVHHHRVPSILLTHQLRLALPNALAWLEPIGELAMSWLCCPYSQVWVPDHATPPGLSGKLGHPGWTRPFPPLVYLGPLTRLERRETPIRWQSVSVVSGPEPARTQLEALLLRELPHLPGRHLVLRGRPDLPAIRKETADNVSVVPHMESQGLARELCACEVVISRGGYSTLMDLAALGCRALIIPTPGQTEQEYLAQNLHTSGHAHCVPQAQLDLPRDLALALATKPLTLIP